MAIDNTRQLIQQITNASSVGENTAARVGNAMEAMLNDVKAADDKAVAATNRINTTEQGIANANQRLTTEEGINATQTAQIEGLRQDIQNIRPVTIEGDVVNNPDNVFLTSSNDEITPKERTTSLSAKGHYIMRPTDNFAAKLKANYIHEIPFDVDLGGASVTIPANAVLKFTGGKISGGSLVLQNTYLDGDVKLAADVAVSGTCANLTAKQSWFADNDVDAWHRFIRSVDVPTYEYVQGEYHPTTILQANNRKVVAIKGNGAKLIWTTPTSDVTGLSGGININHDFTNYTPITVAAAIPIQSHQITMADGHGLAVGDLIVLMDTRSSSFTANFLNGEYLRVRTVNGNTIGLASKTFAQYPNVADIVAAKVEQTRVIITDLELEYLNETSGEYKLWDGLRIQNACGVLRNCKVNGFHYGITIQWCCGIVADGCVTTPLQRASTSEDHYGMALNNSQKVNVCNCDITGGQHGITTGGYGYYQSGRNVFNIPCREIHITNNTIANEQAASWPAIGMHPNIEYGIVSGNIVGGIGAAGGNMVIEGNLIRNCVNTYAVNIASPINYNHIIADNVVEKGVFMFTAERISRTTYPNIYDDDAPECLVVNGNTGNVFFRLQASKGGSTKSISARIANNQFNSWSSSSLKNFVKSDFDEIAISENTFYDNNRKGCIAIGSVNRLAIRNCIIESAITNDYPVSIGGTAGFFGTDFSCEEILIEGNTFKGGNTLHRICQQANSGTVSFGKLIVRGNYFYLSSQGYIQAVKLHSDSSCEMFIFEDNFFEKEAAGIYVTGTCQTARFGRNKWLGVYSNTNQTHQNVTATTINTANGWSAYNMENGSTANRPTLTIKDIGYQYFDTTIQKPIWWNGAAWKDSTGATV